MGSDPDRFSGWRDPGVLAVGLLACAAGFGQFGVTAVLGDIAAAFGEAPPEDGVAAEVGMAATRLGLGLAVIRLASLASLPVAGVADRLGRRRVVVTTASLGLLVTTFASAAWSFWVFVAVVAVARPLLTATNALAGVVAAEETGTGDRAAAIAVVAAGYSIGTGAVSVVRGVAADVLGFRGVFLLSAVPLLGVLALRKRIRETPRFARGHIAHRRLGAVPRPFRVRLAIVCTLTAAVGLVFGPVFTYLFVYGERVLGASPGEMALLVVAAGPTGLAGLVLGRLAADRLGRRGTAAAAMLLVGAGGLVAYRAGFASLAVGYLVTIAAGAAYSPSGGAIDAEIFPTSVRATAAGWLAASGVLGSVVGLAAFGALADALGSFARASTLVAIPCLVLPVLYRFLPETRGLELEESAPEP